MKREDGLPVAATFVYSRETPEARRARLVRSARSWVVIGWLIYACLTAAALVWMFIFYRFGDYGDCFRPTPCPTTLPPNPVLIALGLGAAGLAFGVGSFVAWLPSRRVFAISALYALAITGSWLAVAIAPDGDSSAAGVCYLTVPTLVASLVGWRTATLARARP